ncbi:hypothetical protein [Encephalitozoon cuniculi GB-M1]|uniref:Uncharacterized protein ECU01_0010/ECU01_1600/ECU04_0010 n=1 Tax=Encephalitozoon cuniculi (strain GB-M1) TaxID=284813 RepID=Y101_ENCCU|nr:uncharacterized protein ECU01_0010 [Encephalitozoon cuniculi GB-M1]NP_001402245.1 uncharacterized protein ECU01_1600 [Encephalitozoon cuniculi GB-M1]NP_584685.1 uncharacterized protein ECU04_0010 [Encephalitozoon cuniculi GB-M1]Q8ST80.1 RecName: Full=Uncharacterized protein ECU01_0010/ECU01_1600/ECU04_0010 [Encephalitozoon cuniculi GB-M1]CAD24873.1 hypothetical protein [Encephalitozoon cuniculi GB-M1]CAD25031.1 hypothetical protein [Encephalitozoon cuniculi GB-M1]CAD25189.1 hypothetical pr
MPHTGSQHTLQATPKTAQHTGAQKAPEQAIALKKEQQLKNQEGATSHRKAHTEGCHTQKTRMSADKAGLRHRQGSGEVRARTASTRVEGECSSDGVVMMFCMPARGEEEKASGEARGEDVGSSRESRQGTAHKSTCMHTEAASLQKAGEIGKVEDAKT